MLYGNRGMEGRIAQVTSANSLKGQVARQASEHPVLQNGHDR